MNQSKSKIVIVIEVIIGTTATSALVAVWLINYLSPLLSAKNELALLDAEIIKKKAEFQQQINEEKTHELSHTINIVNKKLLEAQSLNHKYQSQLQDMKQNLEQQKQQYVSSTNNKQLSAEVKSKILGLETQIAKIKEEQEKAKTNAGKLNEILTYSSLNGLWKGTGTIDGKNIYLEFLPKGSIRTYAGLDGEEYMFSNQKWLLEDNNLVILTQHDGKELKQVGTLKDGKIIGMQELMTGEKIKWVLVRTR